MNMSRRCLLALASTLACQPTPETEDDVDGTGSTSSGTLSASASASASASNTGPSGGPSSGPSSTDPTTGTDPTTMGPTTDAESSSSSSGEPPVDVDPGTLAVYMASNDGGVEAYVVADGEATAVAGSPFDAPVRMTSVLVHGDRVFAAQLPTFDPHTHVYDIDPSTGALTLAERTRTTGQYGDLLHHPTLARLYMASQGSSTVQTFAVGDDGSLTELGTAPATGVFPTGLVLHPDASMVYSGSVDGLNAYPVQGDGSLGAAAGGKREVENASAVAVDRHGECLYIGSGSGIAGATLDDAGVPTLLPGIHDEDGGFRLVRTPASDDFLLGSTVGQTATWRIDEDNPCELSTQISTHDFGAEPSQLLEVDGGYVVALVDTSTELHILAVSPGGAMEPIDGSPFTIPEQQRMVRLRQL